MGELLYKELCYKVVGYAYSVYNELGSGLKEKVYGNAFEELLKENSINYSRELYSPIVFKDKIVAKNFLDFLIDDSLVVELKVGSNDFKGVCNQVFNYLRAKDLKLGLIIRFTREGVRVKRIPNLY